MSGALARERAAGGAPVRAPAAAKAPASAPDLNRTSSLHPITLETAE
ncbi:hypothetical protein [Cereibacter azotoformans]|uniref:Uncharacterized protein n=1 Tax=Cereibacter azotoformans TaxID=43057 RepID=A0A2T5K660_9RHOB|nr:hypothetical protein [Cereibacter azotoformans]PTR17900.1 hypothetical protein C8J28_11023 [Cereibacter azotoformans]